MKIAPKQREELDFLRETLDSVEAAVDAKSRKNAQALRQRLDAWAARIAVIGQVKAGKSTFMNAFLDWHDFLPADVNPWTSVVTNVRINVPGDPASGARFEFFSEADWSEIAEGNARIRALTEQLLPGFDTDVLKRQSEEMRARAVHRLGERYQALLGTRHDYDFLSSDLLKRYVCAGPGADAGLEDTAIGQYACITKSADAYMRVPDFRVPTIISDTPGVNDPFLVRDEFTCRSLDRADVFIVVLSAHQPLTAVDIALIRILSQQDSKDCIVFVNRIDELDDYATEVPRVLKDVSDRLTGAIPDIDFKIVAGSAWLADLALREGDDVEAKRRAADTPELAAYLEATYGYVPEDRVERLLLASGIDSVKEELSDAIDNGAGCGQLRQLREDIRSEINGLRFLSRRERHSLQQQVESITSEVAGDGVAELETEIAAIRKIKDELNQHAETADTQIEKVVSRSWTKLQKALHDEIDAFVDVQRESLSDRLMRMKIRGKHENATEIDVLPLQEQMAQIVSQHYAKSRAGTDVALSNCLHACRQTLAHVFNDDSTDISMDELPFDTFGSTLSLSRRKLPINIIAERGWMFWRSPQVRVEKTLHAMRMITTEELRPAVDKVLAAYNEAQVERASAGTYRVRVMLRMVDDSLSERTHRLKRDKAELEQVASDPELRKRMIGILHSKMEVMERRLLTLAALENAITPQNLSEAA